MQLQRFFLLLPCALSISPLCQRLIIVVVHLKYVHTNYIFHLLWPIICMLSSLVHICCIASHFSFLPFHPPLRCNLCRSFVSFWMLTLLICCCLCRSSSIFSHSWPLSSLSLSHTHARTWSHLKIHFFAPSVPAPSSLSCAFNSFWSYPYEFLCFRC